MKNCGIKLHACSEMAEQRQRSSLERSVLFIFVERKFFGGPAESRNAAKIRGMLALSPVSIVFFFFRLYAAVKDTKRGGNLVLAES